MHSDNIIIRPARLPDAEGIASLINTYSQTGIMLPRSVETIVREIRNFVVAEDGEQVVGCCAVSFFSVELAEIRSLAVRQEYQCKGIGGRLVTTAESVLKEEGIKNVFTLTLRAKLFERLGYTEVEKTRFPQKIWRDCLGCSKIMQCDEVALEKILV